MEFPACPLPRGFPEASTKTSKSFLDAAVLAIFVQRIICVPGIFPRLRFIIIPLPECFYGFCIIRPIGQCAGSR